MSGSYFSINKGIGDFLTCTASIDRKADKSRNTTFLSGVPAKTGTLPDEAGRTYTVVGSWTRHTKRPRVTLG